MVHLKTYNDITFSVNLVDQAFHHWTFLSNINKIPALNSEASIARALYRYEKYWLPLANDHRKECLSAPLDIEWAWHCHMLRPVKYINDCGNVVGHVINHKYRSGKDYEKAVKKSKVLWEKKYPDVPFNMDPASGDDTLMEKEAGFQSQISYDVIAAAGRQKEFFYNVSLPHYNDRAFLELGLQRYKKMLYLKQEEPGKLLVPCFDNDLIWHTHQANPEAYHTDMMNLFGEDFDHDDSINSREQDSKLNKAYSDTTDTWSTYFNEPMFLPGGMYRGKAPDGFLYKLTKDDMYNVSTKKTTVSIDVVLKIDQQCDGSFVLIANGCGGAKKVKCLYKSEQVLCSEIMSFKTQTFDFDTRQTNRIQFEITRKDTQMTQVGETSLNLVSYIEDIKGRYGGTFQKTLKLDFGGTMEIKGHFEAPKTGNTLLFIERGDYKPGTIPENITSHWGPVNTLELGPKVDRNCIIASHVLKNHVGKRDLTARVIHCPSICQSFVQVFYDNKMAAVVHFIGRDQLPTPKLVGNPILTLDPTDGERAMLVKNHAGDWAIVKSQWRKSKKSTPEKVGVKGSDGTLHAKVYSASTWKSDSCEMGYTQDTFNFRLRHLQADLPKCKIEIDRDSSDIAENIALTFSLAILHDRCIS